MTKLAHNEGSLVLLVITNLCKPICGISIEAKSSRYICYWTRIRYDALGPETSLFLMEIGMRASSNIKPE